MATSLVGNLSFPKKALVYISQLGQLKAPATGAWNQLWAATADKNKITNGGYYEPVAILGNHDKLSNNEELAGKLWDWTEKELGGYKV